MRVIDVNMLAEKEACAPQRGIFQTLFGESVELTWENLSRGFQGGLCCEWAAQNLLSDEQYKQYRWRHRPLLAEAATLELIARRDSNTREEYEARNAELMRVYEEERAKLFYEIIQGE